MNDRTARVTRKPQRDGEIGRENCDNRVKKKRKRISALNEGKQRIAECLQIFSLLSGLPTENSCCHEAGHRSRRAAERRRLSGAAVFRAGYRKTPPTAYRQDHHHHHRPPPPLPPHPHPPALHLFARFTVIDTRRRRDEELKQGSRPL